MSRVSLSARAESWPLAETFVISRGAKRTAEVVVVEATAAGHTGQGECVPYKRYGETIEGVLAAISQAADKGWASAGRQALRSAMPAGAARNAIDCALWDLEARRSGRRAHELAGLRAPGTLATCFTISLATPEEMAAKARASAHMPLLKLKLGGVGDEARLAAVRAAVPSTRLVVDANEAWSSDSLVPLLEACRRAGVELVEQPLPAEDDGRLAEIHRSVPVCADESVHTRADLSNIARRYDAINVKLDKTGGLTEALDLKAAARAAGLKLMVGCMVATSLAMAPALLLAEGAEWVDLDGPLLLSRDRPGGLKFENGVIVASSGGLWG